jgi:succinate dehydrogenase / fumarate reductase flavoprotein subunit
MAKLDSKIPKGPLSDKWTNHKSKINLVSPANKRQIDVIVVGTGLAGASASATLAELGYNVKTFCFQDSPRRAHSIAAQGGINAAKNYQGDGDSTHRLFYDTIKGGDYRSREANVHRLAEVSTKIMEVYSITVLLEGSWFPEPFTPKDRQGSSCYWVLIRR